MVATFIDAAELPMNDDWSVLADVGHANVKVKMVSCLDDIHPLLLQVSHYLLLGINSEGLPELSADPNEC